MYDVWLGMTFVLGGEERAVDVGMGASAGPEDCVDIGSIMS
jgi:hypothetical protein